jgi:pterin-4a-carbinolamine dehydratase
MSNDLRHSSIVGFKPSSTRRRSERADVERRLLRLQNLNGWTLVDSVHPRRQEIRKMYHLNRFEDVIEFMEFASKPIAKRQHHPRWENQFKSLTVYFSTWDAGCKVTHYDIEAAAALDELFHTFIEGRRTPNPG